MNTKSVSLLLLVFLTALSVRLLANEDLKPAPKVSSTERFDFAPGGTIRVNRSNGDVYVEGWDKPEVELTVIKSLPYEYEREHQQRPAQELESVQVVAERASAELSISVQSPRRSSYVRHVKLEYQLRVPHKSELIIEHGVGYVSVSGVTGDIHAACRRGDIVLWLPDTRAYSIDAKSWLGKVSSDFPGDSSLRFLVGQRFIGLSPTAPQKLYLRVGFGGITLKPILTESNSPASVQR